MGAFVTLDIFGIVCVVDIKGIVHVAGYTGVTVIGSVCFMWTMLITW